MNAPWKPGTIILDTTEKVTVILSISQSPYNSKSWNTLELDDERFGPRTTGPTPTVEMLYTP